MCGRFTHLFTWADVHRLLSLSVVPHGGPVASFNVAPTQGAPVVRVERAGRVGVWGRFGFVPAWAAEGAAPAGLTTINARAETAAEKPLYKGALARSRCVVPVSGFYEWQRADREGGVKQPWYLERADGAVMLLAGLWSPGGGGGERAEAENGGVAGERCTGSFALVTCAANAFMSALHDRMPVVLEPEDAPAWLGASGAAEVAALMRPAADGMLTGRRVSRRVNSPRNNDAALLSAADDEPGAGGGGGGRGVPRARGEGDAGQMGLFG